MECLMRLRLGRILIDVGIGRPVAIKPARGAHAEKLGVLRVDRDSHGLRKREAIALSAFWRSESRALSFLPRKSKTFLESASSLQATVDLMTLAASAIDGKKSARTARYR
jgi:hypothetical protein